jgi:hypothetical protein
MASSSTGVGGGGGSSGCFGTKEERIASRAALLAGERKVERIVKSGRKALRAAVHPAELLELEIETVSEERSSVMIREKSSAK